MKDFWFQKFSKKLDYKLSNFENIGNLTIHNCAAAKSYPVGTN